MEFIEAPAFTHHLAKYLGDEQYRASSAGRMLAAAKAVGVDCGSFITGLTAKIKYG
jgi:hypothetical protein